MTSIEGCHDGRHILTRVAIFRPGDPNDFTHEDAVALLDTGATSSAIGRNIIEKLRLVSHGKRQLMVATEMRLVDSFLFRVGFRRDLETAPENNPTPYIFNESDGFGWTNPSLSMCLLEWTYWASATSRSGAITIGR